MGASKPKYKKFNTQHEAEAFIKENATLETCEALGLKASQGRSSQQYTGAAFEPVEPVAKETKPRAPRNVFESEPVNEPPSGTLKIYTDGSSLANGQAGSRAGLGVYFGRDDERNHSERLPGEPQTNQRAELMAMLRALEIAPLTQDVQIWSDSQYSIKCVTVWADSWAKKQWKTSSGGEVKNQDIIRGVLAKMKERTEVGATTTFQWVKGHANDPGNNEADRLANIGSRMPAV
jgi:ribonuclease HI